jgi:Family of unknown function (DUF5677)
MSTPEMDQAVEETGLWLAILNSLNQFDEMEVIGPVRGALNPTLQEECYITTYYRARSNVSSLLELKAPKHFQAIGMLARGLFELAVDMALLESTQGAPIKMRVYLDIEKLRACRSAVEFEKNNALTMMPSSRIYQNFIANNEARILELAAFTWPDKKFRDLNHWSGMKLPARVKSLPSDMQEMYACFYRQLSWSVHPGLQGSYGLQAETFPRLCGMGLNFAARNYEKILGSMIRVIRLDQHDPLIHKKMQLARYLPLTDSEVDEAALRHDLGLD